MQEDDLIQQTESDIDARDDMIELDDVIDQSVEEYEKDILMKLYNAKMKLLYIIGIFHLSSKRFVYSI